MPDPQSTDTKNTKPNNLDKLEGESLDITAQRLAAIKAVLPEAFDLDGNLVRDKLLEALKPASYKASDDIPSFGLAWPGKQSAFAAAGVPTTATLRPCPEQSVDFDTTKNLLIEGDNLEVLKTLQRSYHGKVKMIYIDPPYNTGKDFVYPDNYGEGLDTYLERTQQKDEDGFWKSTNSETSGRKHANWLSMIAPRLTLARNLLRDDGVIFVSIDDHEVSHLRMLCDEIFGVECFLAQLTWNKRIPKNDSSIGCIHEYVLIYKRSSNSDIPLTMEKDGIDKVHDLLKELRDSQVPIPEAETKLRELYTEEDFDRGITLYNSLDEDYRPWGKINMSWPNASTFGPRYDVLHPKTHQPVKVPDRGWRWKEDTFKAHLAEGPAYERHDGSFVFGRIWFAQDEQTQASSIKYLDELERILLRTIVSLKSDGGIETEKLFAEKSLFDYPKPVSLLRVLTDSVASSDSDDIILDFFSGSGTTGHAVLAQNAEDGGSRRYICVQLPEPLDEPVTLDDGVICETIFDLTRERLKRAGKKINEEAGLNSEKLDTGLRVFKLDSSNFTAWNSDPTTSEADLLERLEQLNDQTVSGRSETDILWEMLLKMGLPLDLQLEQFELEGASFIGVADRTKVISTQESIPVSALEALLGQDIPPSELVVLDSAFADDSARANIATLYKERKDDDGKPVCNLKVV